MHAPVTIPDGLTIHICVRLTEPYTFAHFLLEVLCNAHTFEGAASPSSVFDKLEKARADLRPRQRAAQIAEMDDILRELHSGSGGNGSAASGSGSARRP